MVMSFQAWPSRSVPCPLELAFEVIFQRLDKKAGLGTWETVRGVGVSPPSPRPPQFFVSVLFSWQGAWALRSDTLWFLWAGCLGRLTVGLRNLRSAEKQELGENPRG